jgi:hypothetical protein
VAKDGVRIDNNRCATNIAAAIGAAGVGHVIMLSSIGAQHPDGTGASPQMSRQLAGKRMLFGLSPRISPMVAGCGSRRGVPASGALMTRRSQGPRRPCSRAVLPHGRS